VNHASARPTARRRDSGGHPDDLFGARIQPLKRVLRPRLELGEAGLSAGALEDALIQEKILPGNHGLAIRSDNGLVFGSKRFHETITKYKLTREYITPYTPEQNGMIERFFRSFKEECAWQKAFTDFDDAYKRIADWMDHYNTGRPHSALGYATPAEVRQKLVA